MIEQNPHLRPAQVGDICLLIEPEHAADLTALRRRQHRLHRRFGGNPIRHVHLTCQRFCCGPASRLEHSIAALEQLAARWLPLSFHAIALHTLAVPILRTTTLKWQIAVTPALLTFNRAVEEILHMANLTPQYTPGFTSNMVSALQGMSDERRAHALVDRQLPYHLFDARNLVVSQICGPGQFTILAKISMGVPCRVAATRELAAP